MGMMLLSANQSRQLSSSPSLETRTKNDERQDVLHEDPHGVALLREVEVPHLLPKAVRPNEAPDRRPNRQCHQDDEEEDNLYVDHPLDRSPLDRRRPAHESVLPRIPRERANVRRVPHQLRLVPRKYHQPIHPRRIPQLRSPKKHLIRAQRNVLVPSRAIRERERRLERVERVVRLLAP